MSDLSRLEQRMSSLETRFDERWDQHDKRSEDLTKYLKEENAINKNKIDKLFSLISDLKMEFQVGIASLPKNFPCKENIQRIAANDGKIAWLWGLFGVMLITLIGVLVRITGI